MFSVSKLGNEATEETNSAMVSSGHLPSESQMGPDGCQSWFVAMLCFLVNLLFSSFFRCGGLFFTSMMTTYHATRAQAAMPLGAYCGFVNLSEDRLASSHLGRPPRGREEPHSVTPRTQSSTQPPRKVTPLMKLSFLSRARGKRGRSSMQRHPLLQVQLL